MENNITTNATSSVFIWQVYLSFAALLTVTIVVGNFLTILAVCTTESLRTITNKFVVNLALADLIMAYSLVLTAIAIVPQSCAIMSSKFASLTASFVSNLSILMSFLSLCLIAMDRYIFIVYSLHYHRLLTANRANILLVLSWTIVVTYCGLLFFWDQDRSDIDCNQTTTIMPVPPQMFQVITIAITFVMYFIMMFLYGKILQVILRQRRSIRDLSAMSHGAKSTSDLNFIKVMLSVAGVCTLCWLSLVIFFIVLMFVKTPHADAATMYVTILLYINSAANFFIYAAKDKKLHRAYKKLLCLKQ